MAGIEIVRSTAIGDALHDTSRQYLAGTLQRPQALAHVPDANLEVGVSSYATSTSDVPHFHLRTREYQYVISGHALLRDITSGETHELNGGDFYVIDPGVAHVQKSSAGTTILFFKFPAGDDKVPVPVDPQLAAWLEDLDFA